MSELELINKKLEEIKSITTISVKSALTVEEAAAYMGMSTEYVRKMAKKRDIKSYRSKSGRVIYLHKSDLDKWMLHTEVNTNEYINSQAELMAIRTYQRN
jgi:excisionase family DNA binding protein